MRETTSEPRFCSFCGKHQDWCQLLVGSSPPDSRTAEVFICAQCIAIGMQIVDKANELKSQTPKEPA